MIFDKTVKNISRIGEVINLLLKFGFEELISETKLKRLLPARQQLKDFSEESVYDFSRWERIRMIIEELGTTFIKLAQLLSTRPDILPDALIKEFEKLQSKVPPFSTKRAIKIVEEEIGKPIDEVFSYFDKRTVGAGSIGQVHRARLKNGADVVVKIQRPDAVGKVRTDLILLREFIKHTESYFQKIGILNPLEVVNTFEETMLQELDYKNELMNMLRFRKIYAKETDFYIPKPYKELSTSKVMIIEFAAGCEYNDVEQLHKWGINSDDIAEKVTAIYLKQIFEGGYFHADPHAGNVLVKPDSKVIIVDFGMTGKTTKKQRYEFAKIAINVSQQNPKALAENLKKLAVSGEVDNMSAFESDLENLIDDFSLFDIEDFGVSEFIGRLQQIMFDYKIRISGEIFLILRVLAVIEGIAKKMHPDFKIINFLKPYGRRIIAEQYSPSNLKNDIAYSVSQILSLLHSSPSDIKIILKKARRGELHHNININGLEPLNKQIEIFTGRFTLSLLISAVIIASSIIMIAAPEEMTSFFGMPIVSLIGFGIAVFWAGWLMVYSIRNKQRK